jgi:DivIVA domain-containing protein
MALTPEDVVNKRFQATKFREGYDQDEVDDFLDEVVNELRRLNEENDDLRNKLGACERRVGELSRASVARESAPEPEVPATIAAAVQQPPPPPMPVAPPQPVMAEAMRPEPMRPEPMRSEPMRPVQQLEAVGQGPEAAAGMLALAQKLHDEYVRNGEQQRDRIVNDAREHAQRLVREAEEKQRQTLGSLEQERSLLERKIDELRAFEREYRSRLKSYLEGQLRELEAKAAVVPNRGPQAAAVASGNAAPTYSGNGPLPTRGAYAAEPAPEPAGQSYPFGDRN